MQDLFVVRDGKVIMCCGNMQYEDTVKNFIADGGLVTSKAIDYNKTLGVFIKEGEIQDFPNKDCENNFEDLNLIIANKKQREYVAPPEPTAEEIQAQLTNAVQVYMDKTVQARNYDNIATACTYSTSTDHIFANEGIACVKWRDAVWRFCYEYLAEVKAGTKEVPTAEELIAMLPTLEW